MMTRLFSAVLIGLFTATPAYAQFSFSGDDKDILIKAESATYKAGETILEGDVDVRQGEAQILSDKMFIFRSMEENAPAGTPDFGTVTRIVAEGTFSYTTPDTDIKGNKGVYERASGIITVTGNVRLRQKGGNQVTGNKLVYNTVTRKAKFGDECPGGNCSGRVNFSVGN